MNIFQSLIIALSMYTAIPMPMTEWNEKNLRYCMCFLPVAGLIVAAFQFLLLFVCETLNISPFLYGAAFCGLSVLVTGGIHIDGLIDTSDALGSRGEREKKLQILDDPHAGAFGIAGAILYFLMLAGVAAELYGRYERYEMGKYGIIAAVFSAFLTSRALTAVFVVNMAPSKKKRAALHIFSGGGRQGGDSLLVGGAAAVCDLQLFPAGNNSADPRFGTGSDSGVFFKNCAEAVRRNLRRSVRMADPHVGAGSALLLPRGAGGPRSVFMREPGEGKNNFERGRVNKGKGF